MNFDSPEVLTAQQRLALTRRALISHLRGDDEPQDSTSRSIQQPGAIAGLLARSSYATLARNLIERWWSRHPANAAGHLARPFLERYARQQPVKLLAISAGVGALVILIKPWRLLSVTALLAAFLKTSNVADMVTTLMDKKNNRRVGS